MAEEKKSSPVKTLKEYFGYKPGEGLSEFGAEIKALSDKDKEQLVTGIEDGSMTY